jgi:CHAT domain-containing protein
LREHASRSRAEPLTVLAMGDPAPGASTAPAVRATGPLPHASRELRAVAALYGRRATRLFIGGDATETRFRTEAGRASIVHVATHGILDDGNALYSHCAGGRRQRRRHRRRLEAREIRELNMPADVAVPRRAKPRWDASAAAKASWSRGRSLRPASTAVVSQWQWMRRRRPI